MLTLDNSVDNKVHAMWNGISRSGVILSINIYSKMLYNKHVEARRVVEKEPWINRPRQNADCVAPDRVGVSFCKSMTFQD